MCKEIWEEAVGEELLEKSWCVQENPTTVTIVTLLLSLVAFVTSLLARTIACESRRRDKGPLRLGRLFLGFK